MKLKKLLKETNLWKNRKFGDPLPTIQDYKEAYNNKNNIQEDSVSPSYRRMLNALNNVIPMVFPDSIMLAGRDNPIGNFKQLVMQNKPEAQKEWPKVEKWINKKFKEIKLNKIKDDQQMLKVLSKTAKGMKV